MQKYFTFNVLAGVLALAALLLALLPASRYGTNGDNLQCNQQSTTMYYKSAVEYILLTQPLNEKTLRIGTCPYQNHYAKTYAVELWVLAGIFMAISDRKKVRLIDKKHRM